MTNRISDLIQAFIQKSIKMGDLDPIDEVYTRNRLLELFGEKNYEKRLNESFDDCTRLEILDHMIDYAVDHEIIEDLSATREILEAKIMDLVTPLPSTVNQKFWQAYEVSPQKATDLFYKQSQRNNYIKTREIAKNIYFTHESSYGEMELTINLSKPEKDPKEIALQGQQKETAVYPKNALNVDNEGYAGSISHAARTNHRIIRMDLGDDAWGFQYSPYAYYNEHCIFLAIEDRPMKVDIQAVSNLLEIITLFPHYFVGSNAGLPIVGGSILSHDHYQGGRHTFAIEKAPLIHEFSFAGIQNVHAGIVDWPMSVIRLRSVDKKALLLASERVFESWEHYSDPSVGIYAQTQGEKHNAITPIARRRGDAFELDLVLRNNRTSDEFPDGIFHPHPDVQHIKKENIGLIEVMGLAILPPRLKESLQQVEKYLLDSQTPIDDIHRPWADQLRLDHPELSKDNAQAIVEQGVGEVFVRVLEDAGVFKTDTQGREAFKKYIQQLKEGSVK